MTVNSETLSVNINEAESVTENFNRLFRATEIDVELGASGEDCIAEFVDHLRSA